MSQRQQIVDALTTLLNTTSGLENKVTCWRLQPFQPGDLPAAIFSDRDAEAEELVGGYYAHRLPVNIQVVASGTSAAASVRSLAEAVLTTINTDPTLAGLLDAIILTGVELDGDLQATEIFSANIQLTLEYQTDSLTF